MSGPSPLLLVVFFFAAAGSLGASAVLVRAIERIAGALGLREAALGLLAALAADGPEITSSVTALVHHDGAVSSGVVFGSNAFNLAALLGLSACIAGVIRLDRSVIALDGAVAVAVSALGLLVVAHLVPVAVSGALVGVVVVPYVAVSTLPGTRHRGRIARWIDDSVVEEERELRTAIAPRSGSRHAGLTALVALAAAIGFSIAMEESATTLGTRWGIANAVIGGVVLAAVTSIPNAVAAIYFAGKGRGAATLATAMNSNTANVCFGLMVPIAFVSLAPRRGSDVLIAAATLALTVVALALAWAGRGLGRRAGATVIAGYGAVVVAIVASAVNR